MLSIRLARFGKKKQPSYRIVVSQKHKDAQGDYIESIGFINYFGKEKTIELKRERAEYWLKTGAQPTDTVHNILVDQGLLKDKKLKPSGIKPHKKKAGEEGEKTPEKEIAKSEVEKKDEEKKAETDKINKEEKAKEQTEQKQEADK